MIFLDAHEEAIYFLESPEGSFEQPDLLPDRSRWWYAFYPLLFVVFLADYLVWGELKNR